MVEVRTLSPELIDGLPLEVAASLGQLLAGLNMPLHPQQLLEHLGSHLQRGATITENLLLLGNEGHAAEMLAMTPQLRDVLRTVATFELLFCLLATDGHPMFWAWPAIGVRKVARKPKAKRAPRQRRT